MVEVVRHHPSWLTRNRLARLSAVALALLVVGLLAYGQQRLKENQAAVRANTCNQNALFAQSIASSGNTVDLYRGLRPLLAESSDPDSRAAVAFVDQAIRNLEANRKLREDFLALTVDTARRLHCPAGFVAPGG